MNSTRIKRGLIWGFPILILSAFLIANWFIRSTEKSYQKARQGLTEWTTWEEFAGCWRLTLDSFGNLWVGKDCGGLYLFDGTNWNDINYGKSVDDFEVDLQGQVWILSDMQTPSGSNNFVSVYNRQEWTTYSQQDFGISQDEYWSFGHIGIDSKNRILVTIFGYEEELLVFQNNNWELGSREDFGLPNKWWTAMVGNMEGWIWWDEDSGLYRIVGRSTNEILYEGESLKNLSSYTLDKQNNLWVVNECGNVGKYNGSSWTTYPKEKGGPDFNQEPSYCDGRRRSYDIYIDDHERVWIEEHQEIRMLENGTWTTFTPENTGIVGDFIINIVVDEQDRVWILSDGGLSMIPVEDIQILPQKLFNRWKWAMKLVDLKWPFVFIVIDLFFVWIMVLLSFNVWQGVRSNSMDMPPVHKIKQLAKTSLVFGNLSFGIPCLLFLFYLLGFEGYFIYLLIFVVFLGSVASMVMASITIKTIKKEGGDNDNMVKKAAKRGALLGALGFILLVLIGFFMVWLAMGGGDLLS